MNYLRSAIVISLVLLSGQNLAADFRNVSVMLGPAVVGNTEDLVSTWTSYGPTIDLVFPLTPDRVSPTLGLRLDPLLVINTVQAKVGIILNQAGRSSGILEIGAGAMVGIMGETQIFPVFDSSLLLRQYVDDVTDFEVVYGIRLNLTVYPFQRGTIVSLPLGIVF